MNKALIHTDYKSEWETPPEEFNPLNEIFQFTIDLCASEHNRKTLRYIGLDNVVVNLQDFLKIIPFLLSGEVCWINPPYAEVIIDPNTGEPALTAKGKVKKKNILYPFTSHLAFLAVHGVKICALLPASIDTRWFHDNILPVAHEIYSRVGRIQFIPPPPRDGEEKKEDKRGNPAGSILALFNLSMEETDKWRLLSKRN